MSALTTQPAMQLLAHLGTVYTDQSLARGPALEPLDPFGRPLPPNTVRITEVRLLPGFLELVRAVGLDRAGLLVVIAQLSVVLDGEVVCTATNEELAGIVNRGRVSVGRMVGAARDPAADSLLGAGLVRLAYNVDAAGRRTAGRRLWLDEHLYHIDLGNAGAETAEPSRGIHEPPAEPVNASGTLAGRTPASGTGRPGTTAARVPAATTPAGRTGPPTGDDAAAAATAGEAFAPAATVPTRGSLEGSADDDSSTAGEAMSGPHDDPALVARLLQLGFQGADDAVRRYPAAVLAASLAYVEAHQANIARPAAYLHRLLKAGGPDSEQAPARPHPPPVAGPPLEAPGRPAGPHTPARDLEAPAPTAAATPPAEAAPGVAGNPAPWPPDGLASELIAAVEAQADEQLADHLPRAGRLWQAYCRAIASDWQLLADDG